MIISMISALGKKNVIGKNNALLWNLPADMRRFRQITTGKPVIMGRKTFESIGKPLPNRQNIILALEKDYKQEGCIVVNSIEDAIKTAKKTGADEAMIIGGGQVYKIFLPLADKLYLTLIDKGFEGDTFFPQYNEKEWEIVKKEDFYDEANDFNYSFVDYRRRK